MASGKCFACREVGHLARDCPIENMKRSSSSDPPGLSNFNIELGALGRENSNEVEHLYLLWVSTMTIFQDEISPEERNIAPCTPDWGGGNDIIPADHRSAPSNHRTSDQVPELTGVPWASPTELSTQEEAPCMACPMGDVGAAEHLEGARFILADLQDSGYVICDNRHHDQNDCFAFRAPRQRKQGEGEPIVPQDFGFIPSSIFEIYSGLSLIPNL